MNKADLQELVVQHEIDLYDKLCDNIRNYIQRRAKSGHEWAVISSYDWHYGDEAILEYPLSYYERFMESISEDVDVSRWKFLWWDLPYWTIEWKVKE